MVNNLVLSLVNSILGQGKPTSKGNYAYVCPFHTSNPPGKKNFEINLKELAKDRKFSNISHYIKQYETP